MSYFADTTSQKVHSFKFYKWLCYRNLQASVNINSKECLQMALVSQKREKITNYMSVVSLFHVY